MNVRAENVNFNNTVVYGHRVRVKSLAGGTTPTTPTHIDANESGTLYTLAGATSGDMYYVLPEGNIEPGLTYTFVLLNDNGVGNSITIQCNGGASFLGTTTDYNGYHLDQIKDQHTIQFTDSAQAGDRIQVTAISGSSPCHVTWFVEGRSSGFEDSSGSSGQGIE